MSKFFSFLIFFILAGVMTSFAQPITISGAQSGTLKPNQTYIVEDSLVVNAGETLTVSPGDSLLMKNDPNTGAACWIHVLGTFICEGTATNRIVITTATGKQEPGMWGGIIGDSCKYVSVQYTDVSWAGGNDASGHAYRTFDIYSDYANTTTTVFNYNHVWGSVDDCIGLHGGNVTIKYNTLKWCGAPDGDNFNIKDGTVGEIAYNVIWSPGGNGIKLNASTSLPRITNMCIHNNTICAGGFRRAEELGYAILIDKSSRAQIYNNILGDMYSELEITNKADSLRTVYQNNLFFYSLDTLKGVERYYPPDGIGVPQSNDIMDVKASDLFVSYNAYLNNDYTALDGNNDYHILSTSQAVGKGITPPTPTASNHWGNPFFGNGTQTLPGDANIGAWGVASSSQSAITISGAQSGTLKPNQTYIVEDSLVVNAGETLTVSPGDSLLMKNDPNTGAACWIHVLGTFICEGTADNRIVITTATGKEELGMWGGIIGDSCKYVSVQYTDVSWAGGNDASGHAYRTFDIYSDYSNTTTTVFNYNHVWGSVDDCIGLHGGNVTIKYNTLKWCGAPDGDNFNIKDGTVGEIAYNVIWSPGGNGIKVNASTSLPRITNMCIHNNTICAGGFRRAEELGYAILIDKSSRAQIYNNILGDMYSELEITNKADTLRTVYQNNLFFYSVDSLKGVERYYPPDGIGMPQSNDIIDVKSSNLFASYSADFNNDYIALDGSNDYHLKSSAPAVGKGITPPTPTASNHWGNPFFGNGTQALPGDANIGAMGVAGVTGINDVNYGLPKTFELSQNYPNPFNPSTMIQYSIPYAGHVRLTVYNVIGQTVSELVNTNQSAGNHVVTFNANNLSSGIYFYRLESNDFQMTKKMLLMK